MNPHVTKVNSFNSDHQMITWLIKMEGKSQKSYDIMIDTGIKRKLVSILYFKLCKKQKD